MCEHLDKLVSDPVTIPKFESTHKYAGNNVDRAKFVIPEGFKDGSYEHKFRTKMVKAGLEPVKVDILTLRFVYDRSIRDIAEELQVMSSSTVIRLLDESLAHLKKRIKKI